MKGEGFERKRLEREGLKGFVLPNLRNIYFSVFTVPHAVAMLN